MAPLDALAPTGRTTLRRHPERGEPDRAALHALLDEALVCHVGLATEEGPVVIPTTHARLGDQLLLHGSPASRLLRGAAREGVPVCVTVTLVDGLVLARSAFHHSVNYRSAVVFGHATPIEDPTAKAEALHRLVEHVVPGRMADARPPSTKELAGTLVLSLPLDEASVKVRTGPPIDDEADLDLPVWAGVLPLSLLPGPPEGDPLQDHRVPVPPYVSRYARPR